MSPAKAGFIERGLAQFLAVCWLNDVAILICSKQGVARRDTGRQFCRAYVVQV